MKNPRNELYDLCKLLIENSVTDYADGSHVLVVNTDFHNLMDCIARCDEYENETKRSYAAWCKERGQWP